MMREIDRAMAQKDIPITARPMMVGREIWLRYKIDFPFNDPGPNGPSELRRFWPLSQKVDAWFKATYGDLLNVDPSPGPMVLNIDGDLYRMRLPRFWGTGEFIVSRRFFETENFVSRGFVSNILQLIDDMTEAKAQHISDDAIRSVVEWFPIGLQTMYVLEAASEQHELAGIARSDLSTAVEKLMERGKRFGDSRWASLQMAEKCLKAAIDLHGGKFDRTHKLEKLGDDLAALGVQLGTPALLDTIQCTPGIRYGKEPCSREEALAAHQAVVRLVVDLINAGARFRNDLTIRKLSPFLFQTIRIPPPCSV